MFQNMLKTLPGLVGEVARYVYSKLKAPNASIAMASAFAFVGALKSGRIECEGIRTNLYCCIVAPSGSGKSQAQSALESLIEESGLESLLMGVPASDSGLLQALSEEPRRLLIWDEFGIALSDLAASRASYRTFMLSTIMHLYSKAGGRYRGKQYNERKRVDIDQPHLSILAASTPNRFYGSLNENFVTDGFLSRWLIFHCEVEKPNGQTDGQITPDAIELIKKFQTWQSGNGDLSMLKVDLVPWTIDESYRNQAEASFQFLMDNSANEVERIFWTRGYEQFIKIFLILADSQEDLNDRNYCIASSITTSIIKDSIKACSGNLGANLAQKALGEKIRNLLKPGEQKTLSEISKRCYNLGIKRSDRDQCIESLIESGEWIKQRLPTPNNPKPVTIFKRNLI